MNKSKPDQSFNPTTRHEEVLQSESTEPVQRDELDSELSGSNGPTLDQEEHVLQSELHVAVPEKEEELLSEMRGSEETANRHFQQVRITEETKQLQLKLYLLMP